jgi:1-acyl-sn-glycerol-3-phosphate acyltransferase
MNESVHINEASSSDAALPFPAPLFAGFRAVAFTPAALLRWWQLGCSLGLGLLRVLGLGVVIPMAFVHAVFVRWTSTPRAAALARSRAEWFHRWSGVACRVLGLDVERRGFVPVSGVVIVGQLSLIDTLVLASVTPFVFVMDMSVRRRPILGWGARLAGALFRDRRCWNDGARINFLIERALRRRQIVVVSRYRDRLPFALLQPVVDCRASLTACAILGERADSSNTAGALTQPRSRIDVVFHPPAYHHGNRKELAQQIWCEVQRLECADRGITPDCAKP